jgi:hypothetical protein
VATTLPIYLLAPTGGVVSPSMLDRIPEARAVTSLEELLGAGRATHEPGWILLSSKAPADFLISVISRLQGEVGGWAPLLVLDDDEAPSVAPLLLGYAEALESALPRIRGAEANSGLLSFRALLRDLAPSAGAGRDRDNSTR